MARPSQKILRGDIIVLLFGVLLCAVSFVLMFTANKNVGVFTVKTPDGVREYSLTGEYDLTVDSCGHTLRVCVAGGTVSVSDSDCPDKVCVRTGKISRAGQAIICIPAEVVIEITGGGKADEDFIVG